MPNFQKRKHVRQPPAVPFLWEQKPGIPKRDWKPEVSSVSPIVVTPPVKLIASIPFDWEEKPGTPLPRFSQPAVFPNPPEKLLALPWPPPLYSQGLNGIFNNDEASDDDQDEQNGWFDFDTGDSFSSAPSLLANCLVPSAAISSAVPVQRSFSTDTTSDELEIPSSPASEADGSTTSYESASLVGASFLECLFPLLPPKTSFLEKARYTEWDPAIVTPEVKSKDFDCESNSTVVIRRPTTLGELIMMSRRRSYQRKAFQMKKQNPSMVNPQLVHLFYLACFLPSLGLHFPLGYKRTRKYVEGKAI